MVKIFEYLLLPILFCYIMYKKQQDKYNYYNLLDEELSDVLWGNSIDCISLINIYKKVE